MIGSSGSVFKVLFGLGLVLVCSFVSMQLMVANQDLRNELQEMRRALKQDADVSSTQNEQFKAKLDAVLRSVDASHSGADTLSSTLKGPIAEVLRISVSNEEKLVLIDKFAKENESLKAIAKPCIPSGSEVTTRESASGNSAVLSALQEVIALQEQKMSTQMDTHDEKTKAAHSEVMEKLDSVMRLMNQSQGSKSQSKSKQVDPSQSSSIASRPNAATGGGKSVKKLVPRTVEGQPVRDRPPTATWEVPTIPLVPWPRDCTLGKGDVVTLTDLRASDSLPSIIKSGVQRYAMDAFGTHAALPDMIVAADLTEAKVVTSIVFDIDDESEDLADFQLDTKEGYTLVVTATPPEVRIAAPTVWGALQALQTLGQLTFFDFDRKRYFISGVPVSIVDEPRFPYRGFLLDTVRHWIPIWAIEKTVDAMAMAKFNVLHWHGVDAQTFSVESPSFPNLWSSAYSPSERYTIADVQRIVEYARLRAVRVMFEFDVPGHAQGWCQGYPEICPTPECPMPLNPASNLTLELIESVITDYSVGRRKGEYRGKALSPFDLVHVGGDEVLTTCWKEVPAVAEWMADNDLGEMSTFGYFVEKAGDIVKGLGRRPVQWEEAFNHGGGKMIPEAIVMAWLSKDSLRKAVEAGHHAILCNYPVWYGNYQDVPWKDAYNNEPLEEITDESLHELVLGGEYAVWGEHVDASNLFLRQWPRAAGAAERLWSPRDVVDNDDFKRRLLSFRCYLQEHGVPADVVDMPHPSAEYRIVDPGSCFHPQAAGYDPKALGEAAKSVLSSSSSSPSQ